MSTETTAATNGVSDNLVTVEDSSKTVANSHEMDVDDNKLVETTMESCLPENFDKNLLLELSPDGLRRSQRASAKRAQQRIRGQPNGDLDDDKNSMDEIAQPSVSSTKAEDECMSEPPEKIRKLVDPMTVDFSDPHLAIQLMDNGDVVYASDESEVSTLNSKDVELIRKNYKKLKSKELTEEQYVEREIMIQELKAQLRIEESRLSMMKKLRANQRVPVIKETTMASHQQSHQSINKLVPSTTKIQSIGNVPPPPAYRPPLAVGSSLPVKSVSHDVKPKSNAVATAVHQTKNQPINFVGRPLYGTQHAVKTEPAALKQNHHQSASSAAVQSSSAIGEQQHQQTPAQRQAAAKLALRKQLEKTLLQIPHPRPPPADLQFVPNPNQLEFVTLLGLDEIVDRITANKIRHLTHKSNKQQQKSGAESAADELEKENSNTSNKKTNNEISKNYGGVDVYDEPFACVQCGTDFTPTWKSENGRVKCEQCFRSNKKKALKVEHTNRLKQAFVKALQQEQEIERQINDGTFNLSSLGASPSSNAAVASPATMKSSSSSSHHHHHHQEKISSHHTPSVVNKFHHISQNHNQISSSKSSSSVYKTSTPNAPTKQPTSSSSISSQQQRSSSSSQQHRSSTSKSGGGNVSATSAAGVHAPTMGYPAAAAQLMANLGWNQLMAAAAASRFSQAQQQQQQQNAAAAALALGGLPQSWMQNMQNLPADFVKTFQQLQQQQFNATLQQQQQKLFREAMLRPPKWK